MIRQLEQVRRLGRSLLIAQRILQWSGAALLIFLILALLDYALRLPGPLRLLIDLALLGGGIAWLVQRLGRAWRVWPRLSDLALRAERVYPALAGALASGVEFATTPERYATSAQSAALTQKSLSDLESKLGGIELSRLIDYTSTLRYLSAWGTILIVFAGSVVASPSNAALAAQRWLVPLGSVQWPKRTSVQSLMTQETWPSDTPLRLAARVDPMKGYRPGMRTYVNYRWIHFDATHGDTGQAESWQSLLMNEQAAGPSEHAPAMESTLAQSAAGPGTFERLIVASQDLSSSAADAKRLPRIEFNFSAGDDQTAIQTVQLVARPSVVHASATVEPPLYAQGSSTQQTIALDQQTGIVATGSGLTGSRVTLKFQLNKSIGEDPRNWARIFPGFAKIPDAHFAMLVDPVTQSPTISCQFALHDTVESQIKLTDEAGLSNLSDRVYRIEAIVDQPPTVTMTKPGSDESVLATASVPLEAVAQDDLAIESVGLVLLQSAPPSADGATPSAKTTTTLKTVTGRAATLASAVNLDVAALGVKLGDELQVYGVARDTFDLDGRRHDEVKSSPRRLRIIDEATLTSQVFSELGSLRQQAIRTAAQQDDAAKASTEPAQAMQQDVTRKVKNASSAIQALKDRVAENRLKDPQVAATLERGDELLNQAGKASEQADAKLDAAARSAAKNPEKSKESREQAHDQQTQVAKALSDLASMLDQGGDTAALQMQLKQLLDQQEDLSKKAQALLPKTMGQTPDQLPKSDRDALTDMADKQKALSERAQQLTQQMESSAENLSKQDQSPQGQAASAAMAQAAATSKREGLSQKMDKASAASKENRLSEANQEQQDSAQTMKQMLDQLSEQESKRQEVLKRKMQELAQAIGKLIEQQKAQAQILSLAVDMSGLDEPMSTLRRNTMAVAESARATPPAAAAVGHLDAASDRQADAVDALRKQDKVGGTQGEQQALNELQAAVFELEKAKKQGEKSQANKQRDELRNRYLQLAREQIDLRDQTKPLTGVAQPNRRQRSQMIELGDKESDLQIAVADLESKVAEVITFVQLHKRIEETASSVVSRLRSAQSDDDVLVDQESIALLLNTMADALKNDKKNDPFSGDNSSGKGGGGGKPPLVPPTAELKLLRSMQNQLLDQTARMSQAPATDQNADAQRANLLKLSVRQRELSSLGDALIQKMAQQQQGPEKAGAGGGQ